MTPFIPTEGIHRDLPADAYHAVKAASASYLKVLDVSPAHCLAAIEEEKKSTPDKDFGTACHCAILEPDLFGKLYSVADQCSAITGKGSRCESNGRVRMADGKWLCGTHMKGKGMEIPAQDFIALSPENFDKAQLIGESVRRHPAAREILEAASDIELSAFWRDGETGVLQKLRTDIVIASAGIVADLKTTQDASPEGFSKAVWDYRYDLSAANYLRGLHITYQPFNKFQFIAMEKVPPFAVAVYQLDNDDIYRGMEELDRLLAIWDHCEKNPAEWHRAYSLEVQQIGIPAWARKRQSVFAEAD